MVLNERLAAGFDRHFLFGAGFYFKSGYFALDLFGFYLNFYYGRNRAGI